MSTDVWAQGSAYDPYIGRWSRLVADGFVDWLDVAAGARWLDVGCGTGALTGAVLRHASPADVLGVDSSEEFLGYARAHVTHPAARFEIGSAMALPLGDGEVDAAVSGLMLNFVPAPEQAAAEMVRVTRPGGVVAAYLWDYAEGMQLIRRFWDVAVAFDPDAAQVDEAVRFPLCRPEPLRALFAGAGLSGVDVRAIEVPTRFRDFDDFWTPFLGGQGPAPGYVASLDQSRRDQLRDELRRRLPQASDGSIDLVARAWAVRGHRR